MYNGVSVVVPMLHVISAKCKDRGPRKSRQRLKGRGDWRKIMEKRLRGQ